MKPGFYFSLLISFLLAFSSTSFASEWPQKSGPFDLPSSTENASDPGIRHSLRGVNLDGVGLEFIFDETTTLNLGYGDFDNPASSFAPEGDLIEEESGKLGIRLTRMF